MGTCGDHSGQSFRFADGASAKTVRPTKTANSFQHYRVARPVKPRSRGNAARIESNTTCAGRTLATRLDEKFFSDLQCETWRSKHSARKSSYRFHRSSSNSHKCNVVTYQYWCWICGAGITSYDSVGDSGHGGVFDWQRSAVTERCDSWRSASDGKCVAFSLFYRRSPDSRRIQWNIFAFGNVRSSRKWTPR